MAVIRTISNNIPVFVCYDCFCFSCFCITVDHSLTLMQISLYAIFNIHVIFVKYILIVFVKQLTCLLNITASTINHCFFKSN